jgi:ethanolamine utilization protein EutN
LQIAIVTGEVVSTIKHCEFNGYKMLLVKNQKHDGSLDKLEYISIDTVDAGIGDRVIISKEGGGARILLENDNIPIQALIVGVVDDFDLVESQ